MKAQVPYKFYLYVTGQGNKHIHDAHSIQLKLKTAKIFVLDKELEQIKKQDYLVLITHVSTRNI